MDCKMNICQVNANKSYVVMSELGVYMCEKRVSVALVQEPYVLHGSVRGLPTGFRVVTSGALGDGTGVSAVVINDANVDILVIDKYTNVYGVCVDKRCLRKYVCGLCVLQIWGAHRTISAIHGGG